VLCWARGGGAFEDAGRYSWQFDGPRQAIGRGGGTGGCQRCGGGFELTLVISIGDTSRYSWKFDGPGRSLVGAWKWGCRRRGAGELTPASSSSIVGGQLGTPEGSREIAWKSLGEEMMHINGRIEW